MSSSETSESERSTIEGRNSNLEIKARINDLTKAREIAQHIATDQLGQQHQVDSYFHCQQGRLKLREIDGQTAQLVWYHREDQANAKRSDYCIIIVDDASTLKQALRTALGARKVVDKQREIYLYENVRIHLDEVQELGTFLELEAVLSADEDDHFSRKKVDHLLQQFQISANDLLPSSYVDMV